MMERSVYYNQFDGFTARSDSGREETDKYFQRLGISGFVNLITCSDNYIPSSYPDAKLKMQNRLSQLGCFLNQHLMASAFLYQRNHVWYIVIRNQNLGLKN